MNDTPTPLDTYLSFAVLPAFSLLIGVLLDSFSPANFADPNYRLVSAVTDVSLYFVCIFLAHHIFHNP